MKSTFTGREAEDSVAKYLTSQGFKMLVQNWRTKICEIDLVAEKDKVVYFVEVKFRAHDSQGDGLEYITPRKLKQMQFAAEVWSSENNWNGDCRLLAAAVSGLEYEEIDLVEI